MTIVRIVFESAELRCCVAILPDSVPVDPISGRREVVLQPLPVGPANVVLSGFPTLVAPAPPGVTSVCPTVPVEVGRACTPGAADTPSFTSDPTALVVEPGGIADLGQVPVQSVPFVVEASRMPAPGTTAASPVSLGFVVADASSAIDPASVNVELTDAEGTTAVLSMDLTPCDDRGSVPCSAGGALDVTGLRATAAPRLLPAGQTNVRVRASNLADPPRSVDTQWRFRAAATIAPPTATFTPTSTRTPAPTDTPTVAPTATTTRTASATATRTVAPSITATHSPRPTPIATATSTVTLTATLTRPPTSTPTATGTATATPSRTRTGTRTIGPTIPPCTLQSPENPCVPGSGASRSACDLEWLFSPAPAIPASGIPRRSLVCEDGDPACDADGRIDGRCTFDLSLCINNHDPRLSSCVPSQLDSFEVTQPNPNNPRDAFDTANLLALEGAAGPNGFGVTVLRGDQVVFAGRPNTTPDLCSAPLDIVVPLAGSGGSTTSVRRLRLRATDTQVTVRLSCRPNS